ncbi:MAG: acyl carrier protein [Coriobacteriia bacterium]|nr:acyl carrier protein [Coriobacteriia bacterium]
MMSENIIQTVREVLVGVRDLDPTLVVPDARLIEDLGADSLDSIEIIMALEERFEKELDDADIESIKTVGDIVALIEGQLQ